MSTLTILLAEDDADDRDFFQMVIRSRTDISLFSIAENGDEVLDLLLDKNKLTGHPDLILLDQNMPKRNGLQTLLELQNNLLYKTIPVFIYSTYADDMIKQRSIAGGAASVFSKPYTIEDYHLMIDAMINLAKKFDA